MSNTTPWNGDALAIVETNKGLTIRRATKDHNPAHVFEANDLASLFATLVGSGLPVLAENFVMYGKDKGENGKAKAIQAAVQRDYIAKDGSPRKANDAYSAKQVKAFEPVGYAVLTAFRPRKGGGTYPAPLFLAYATERERAFSSTLERVNVKPEEKKSNLTRVNAPKA